MTEVAKYRIKRWTVGVVLAVIAAGALISAVLTWDTCTVTWVCPDGTAIQHRTLRGFAPKAPAVDAGEGWTFVGWADETGATLDPATLHPTQDVTLTARRMPALETREHPVYLTLSEQGLFLPEDTLTVEQAEEMLRSLITVPWPQPFFAGQPETSVTAGMLAEVLTSLVPAGTARIADFPADPDTVLTRGTTAVLMNRYLDRDGSSAGTLAGVIPDVDPADPLYGEVAEAVVAHTFDHTDTGEHWRSADPIPAMEPGLLTMGGRLYCIGEDGYLVRGGSWGNFQFDDAGVFTTGMPELDELVQAVLAEICDDTMTDMEKLRAAYDYTVSSFTYLRRNYYAFRETGWGEQEAYTMLSTGYGNCYCYAATFYELARALGYDAVLISGYIGRDAAPHGWVEIPQDGQMYVCDPEIEMTYHRDKDYIPDMFMMTYPFASAWSYQR